MIEGKRRKSKALLIGAAFCKATFDVIKKLFIVVIRECDAHGSNWASGVS